MLEIYHTRLLHEDSNEKGVCVPPLPLIHYLPLLRDFVCLGILGSLATPESSFAAAWPL